jgi:hypothetical protein
LAPRVNAACSCSERDERKGHEGRGHDHAGHGKDDLDVVVVQPRAEITLQTKQQDKNEPGNDGRHRERKVNQGNKHGLAAELEFGDGPGRRQTKDEV